MFIRRFMRSFSSEVERNRIGSNSEEKFRISEVIKYNKASFLAKPFVLQKLLGGRSIPWIEFHDLPDKDSVFF